MTREEAPTIFERFQMLMEDETGPGKVRNSLISNVCDCLRFFAYLFAFTFPFSDNHLRNRRRRFIRCSVQNQTGEYIY